MAPSINLLLLSLLALRTVAAEPALLDIKKAAEAGDSRAQKQLAQRYESGFNFSEAEYWYKKAANAGDPEILLALGRFYCGGKPKMFGSAPVPFNATNAVALLSLAAIQGHKRAQHDLGIQYNVGNLVPRDRIRAYQLFRLSASVVDKIYIDKLILEMPTEEIEQAEKLVKEFRPKLFQEAFPEMIRAHLQLQGIAGAKEKLFAVINGRTLEEGKTAVIEVAALPVEIRCDRIGKRLVAVSFLGTKTVLQIP